MKKTKSRAMASLCIALGIIATFGYSLCLYSVFRTLSDHSMLSQNLCLKNDCIEVWTKCVADALAIGKATSDLLVALATSGGIIVALLTYFAGERNSSLTNHLAHYSTFQNYIISEIEKRNRINRASVDISLWYNLIYENSRHGDMNISKSYLSLIDEINLRIQESNKQARMAKDGSFRYRQHQDRIIRQLSTIGIEITRQPRNEFYEIEGQIFSLISTINKSFCHPSSISELENRAYI